MRRVALIGAAGALAVAAEEGVLRLRAGAVGPALRVTAEAAEGVGTAGQPALDASQLRRVADRLAIRAAAAPAVLRTEQIAEQLVADDEERVDAQAAAVEAPPR